MASLTDLYANQGNLTLDQFMAATPEDRNAYLLSGAPSYNPRSIAGMLRNVIPDTNSSGPLTADQYRNFLTTSGLDPNQAGEVGQNLGIILQEQARAAEPSFVEKYALPAGLIFAGGLGLAGAGAFGAGAGAASAGGTAGLTEGIGGGALGTGLSSTAGGVTGLTAGTTTGGIGGGALGGGIGAGTGSAAGLSAAGATGLGALGAGSLAGESLYPTVGGLSGSSGGVTGAAGSASGGGTVAAAGAAAAGTPLSRVLDGTASTADYLSIGGGLGAAGLGAYAANQQSNDLNALADKYLAIGAPSRSRYESSFAPGFSLENEPGYKAALDQTTEAFLRKASMQGNPADNPGAWAETLKGVNTSLALPALYNYRNQNAATGGYGAFNSAAPGAATGAIGAQGNVYNAIGAGAADLFNPRPAPITLNDIYRASRGGLA